MVCSQEKTAGNVKSSTNTHTHTRTMQLGSEPDPSYGEEEGSGHNLTFELSPGRNVDLMYQKR